MLRLNPCFKLCRLFSLTHCSPAANPLERKKYGVPFEYGQEVKWAMQHLIKGNLDDYEPPVMISYATVSTGHSGATGGGGL